MSSSARDANVGRYSQARERQNVKIRGQDKLPCMTVDDDGHAKVSLWFSHAALLIGSSGMSGIFALA